MRKFVALMAAAVMLFAFCASANAATQVTIWHTFTDAQQAALEKFAADFNASQSDYEVVVESQAYSGFLDTVYNAVANGVGPNMIINYASTAADYVKDGLVVDLSKYVFDEEIGMADVYNSLPESIKAETVGFSDGGMYALPAVTTGPIFFINKTIYDELGLTAPTTWEELAENSKKIYEAKGVAGFAADSLTDMMQALMMQSLSVSYTHLKTLLRGGRTQQARACFKILGHSTLSPQAHLYLSSSYKRGREWDEAAALWKDMIARGEGGVWPYIELAKYYEHVRRDYDRAQRCAAAALQYVLNTAPLGGEDEQLAAAIFKRIDRLKRKQKAQQGGNQP